MFENIKIKVSDNAIDEFMPVISFSAEGGDFDDKEDFGENLPLLVLRNSVLFPGQVIPITIGREKSRQAVIKAEGGDKLIAVFTQVSPNIEDPSKGDLYEIGVLARILKVIKMPDGSMTAILQGRTRLKMMDMILKELYYEAKVIAHPMSPFSESKEYQAVISGIKDYARRIIELSPHIPSEATIMMDNLDQPKMLLSFIASNLNIGVDKKQNILEINDPLAYAKAILEAISEEYQMLELKSQIESKVKGGIDKQQKEYFLNQQLKLIQEELGNNPQSEVLKALEEKAAKKKWPERAKKVFDREIRRIKRINPQFAEYSVALNYLELLVELPWDEVTDDVFNLRKVQKILDSEHYGLTKVKDRIVEHLAVLKLKKNMKAPILCLVGPPGVGKTSLGKSIANALGRKFVRMSLGGIHDESEIRGHRKTYIGAMPGRIIQSLKKVKSSNPVFILDEIDKIGMDFRGDPSSALLEVLDPEQNSTFYDNYLEVEYDLSKILFIATANSLGSIQPALRDRMEIIFLSGYSTEEKIEIAKRHLIPKQLEAHGLTSKDIKLNKPVISDLIQYYTREAGVRSLERIIGAVMRNVAKKVVMGIDYNPKITKDDLVEILGPAKINPDKYVKIDLPGVAIGLAWTSVGGDILFIEASTSKGKGKLNLTGNLGDVMKESAQTAMSYIKAHCEELGIDPDVFENKDIHIHVPQGAVPKDGPSAGITMLTALTSALTGKIVKSKTAMTGEITLRGKVLPVGGIKEKILAAKRAGIKRIILCSDNEKDIDEIEPMYVKGMEFVYVDKMMEVIKAAF